MLAEKPIITTAVALYVVVIKSLCIPCYAANIAAAVTPTRKKHDHFLWSCFFVSSRSVLMILIGDRKKSRPNRPPFNGVTFMPIDGNHTAVTSRDNYYLHNGRYPTPHICGGVSALAKDLVTGTSDNVVLIM